MALWKRGMAEASRSIIRSIASFSMRYAENAAVLDEIDAPVGQEASSKPSKDQRRLKQKPAPGPRPDNMMRHRVRNILQKASKEGTTFEEAISNYDGEFTMAGFERALVGIQPKFAIEFFRWGKSHDGFFLKPRLVYSVMDALRKGQDLVDGGRKFVGEMAGDGEAERVAYSGLYFHHLIAEEMEQAEKLKEEMKSRGIELHPTVFGRLQDKKFLAEGVDAALGLYREHMAQGWVADGDGLYRMISGLCVSGRVEEAYKIFMETGERGAKHSENSHYALVHNLAKMNKLDESYKVAEMLFESGMKSKSTPFKLLINKLAQVKKYEEAFRVLREMFKLTGNVAGVRLINLLCFDNELDLALRVVKEVGKVELDDQKVLLLKLCKANRLDDARFVFNNMLAAGAKPDWEICSALALMQQKKNSSSEE